MHPVISVNAAHLKSAYKGTIFIYSGSTGNDKAYILAFGTSGGNEDYRTWNTFNTLFAKACHQFHLWRMVIHIQSLCLSPTGIKDWISYYLKFSQRIMQQIVFIILSRM